MRLHALRAGVPSVFRQPFRSARMHALRLIAHAAITCTLILGGSILVLLAVWIVLKAMLSPFRLAAWLNRKRGNDG